MSNDFRSLSIRPLLCGLLAAAMILLSACGQQSPQALIESGRALEGKGETKTAIIQYKAALQADPAASEARWLLGRALLATGDPQGAVLELSRAKDAGRPAADVLPLLAKALLDSGEPKKLIQTLGTTNLADKSAQAEFLVQLATAWAMLGDRARTEGTLSTALALAPDQPSARLLHARLQADKGLLAEAMTEVEAVLQQHNSRVDAWFLRGELKRVAGDPKASADSFSKVLSLDRAHVGGHAGLVGLKLEANDLEGARKQADLLRAAVPVHPMTALIDAELAFLSGDLLKARERVQKLLAAFPERTEIVILAGLVESKLGSLVQASALLGKAVSMSPTDERARVGLAEVELRFGQYSRALDTLKPILELDSPKPVALALAGQAELRLGNDNAADRYFQAAAKSNPKNTRLQVLNLSRRLNGDEGALALTNLQTLASQSKDTYADQAVFAAHLSRRDFDAALATLEVMSKKAPSDASILELRGRVYLAKRDPAAARLALEAAVKADPSLFGAVAALVTLDLADKKPDAAMQRLQAVITARPDDILAMMALGELKARQGAPQSEVKQLFVNAVKIAPGASEPRLKLIDLALRKRQYKEALNYAREALSAMPNDALVMNAAGKAQLQAGDYEQAVGTFRKLAGALPKAGGPYLLLAQVYRAQNKLDAAENAVSKALELEPDNVDAQMALVDILASTNHASNALQYVRRIQQSKPRSPVGYALEAALQARQRNEDAAATVLREGVAKTGSSDLARRLFSLYVVNKRTADASKLAQDWLKQHPDDAAFEYVVSVQEIALGDLRSAEARLRRVVAAYPKNALALNNLAWVLVQRKDKAALEYAQRANDILPDRPAFMDTLALALAAENRLAPAIELQRAAMELDPQDQSLRLTLARLALQAGDKAVARDELRTLEKLGPKFEEQTEVAKLLKQL